MTTQTVIEARTAARTESFDASAYGDCTIFAVGLAGAEVVDVLLMGGAVGVPASKADGSPLQLTLATPSALLPGGPMYQIVKGATAGACSVHIATRLP